MTWRNPFRRDHRVDELEGKVAAIWLALKQVLQEQKNERAERAEETKAIMAAIDDLKAATAALVTAAEGLATTAQGIVDLGVKTVTDAVTTTITDLQKSGAPDLTGVVTDITTTKVSVDAAAKSLGDVSTALSNLEAAAKAADPGKPPTP